MSERPFTLSEANAVLDHLRKTVGGASAFTNSQVARFLNSLRDAGITVTFPEPRFYAERKPGTFAWFVYDRVGDLDVACFTGAHPHAEQAAQAEADRLNREETT